MAVLKCLEEVYSSNLHLPYEALKTAKLLKWMKIEKGFTEPQKSSVFPVENIVLEMSRHLLIVSSLHEMRKRLNLQWILVSILILVEYFEYTRVFLKSGHFRVARVNTTI